MKLNKIIAMAFFAIALARFLYIKFVHFDLYTYDEAIILALLGLLANFAFDRRAERVE